MILTIRKIGDPILEKPCREITNPLKYKRLIKDMIETATAVNAIGLAANQVGQSVQLFLYGDGYNLMVAINPIFMPVLNNEIEQREADFSEEEEGCLSVPRIGAIVKRYSIIKANYLNPNGEKVEHYLSGTAAKVYQHEWDHCQGILFLAKAEKIFYIK